MSGNLKTTVARAIRFFREKAGLSQAALAKSTRLHVRYIQRLEQTTKAPNLTLDAVAKIARALKIEPHQLLQDPVRSAPQPDPVVLTPVQACDLAVAVIHAYRGTLD